MPHQVSRGNNGGANPVRYESKRERGAAIAHNHVKLDAPGVDEVIDYRAEVPIARRNHKRYALELREEHALCSGINMGQLQVFRDRDNKALMAKYFQIVMA